MGKKGTNIEVEKRIEEIAEILTRGGNRQDIIRYCAEKHDIGERQADNYIGRAWETIKESAEKDRDRNINLAIRRYEDLYRRSHKVQDYRECRQVISDMVKLLGLAEPDKIEHKGGVNISPIEWVKSDAD